MDVKFPNNTASNLVKKIDTFDVTTTFLSAGAAKKCRFIKNWALSFGSLDLIANNTANRGNISTFSVTRNVNAVGSKF
jgi:spore coat protein U-like protein